MVFYGASDKTLPASVPLAGGLTPHGQGGARAYLCLANLRMVFFTLFALPSLVTPLLVVTRFLLRISLK